jgi:hypothetical protein
MRPTASALAPSGRRAGDAQSGLGQRAGMSPERGELALRWVAAACGQVSVFDISITVTAGREERARLRPLRSKQHRS